MLFSPWIILNTSYLLSKTIGLVYILNPGHVLTINFFKKNSRLLTPVEETEAVVVKGLVFSG